MIEDYKFSDSDLSTESDGVDRLVLTVKYYDQHYDLDSDADAVINKSDVIALAKALGVTAEDLI